jgi:hypothetical protein
MLQWLVLALSALFQASATPPDAYDVAALKIGTPTSIVELDMGRLKGDLRQVGWSPDGEWLYVQTAEGSAQSPKIHHYGVAITGDALRPLDVEPDWAEHYWAFKSDRSAPGIGSLVIGVEQKIETIKAGTGPAGALDRSSGNTAVGNLGDPDSIAKGTDQYQKANVVRLKLLDETISEFVNEPAVPGAMFSWGPEKSGAIAFTDRDGRLTLLDQRKHKHAVSGIKDARFPAWTLDGTRLAWVQRNGRKKYTLMYATVDR